MARIRTVKPEMAQSLTVAGWSLLAQMLWPRLFCHLDDEGRCVYDPRLLRANLAPLVDECTSDAMAAVVGEWQASGSVQVYTVDGRDYLQVCEWDKHQKINRPSESDHPPPEDADEDSPTVHGGLSEDSPTEGKGTGNREQGTQGASADADDAPDDDKVDEAFEQFWQAYPPTNGVMRDKKGARKQWAKLSWDERRDAYRGAKNKAAHFQATGEEPPYALRFLRRRDFLDYQQPVTVDKATGQVRTIDTTPTCVHCQQALGDAHDDGMCPNGQAEAA